MFTSIFRCNPISAFWAIGKLTRTCMPSTIGYTLVTIGLAIDIAIFALPAILVVRLNIAKKKKLQSIVMFALGGGGCIVESLRFNQLYEADRSHDITYNSGKINIFAFIQVVLGMLCCCAPAIKVFAVRLFDSRFECSKCLRAHSDDLRETATRDASNARNPEDGIESGYERESIFGDASTPSEFTGRGPSAVNIEMDMRGSGATGEDNDKYGTIVTERIMDLKEVLKISNEKVSLAVSWDGEASRSTRSNSSRTYEEFQATPLEWGRQLSI
ncbi:hypothetical protein TWF281_007449 [Arthrobotrys megalospora]